MDLSIIIVSWNTREFLQKCLESVFCFPPHADFEVLVVDNASSDGSVEMLSSRFPKHEYPQMTVFPNKHNGGFAQGNNQAIRESIGRYVLLLNPDTEVRADAFDELIRFMNTHPTVGGAGSMLLNPDLTLQPSCHPIPTLSREFWRLFHLDSIVAYGDYDMTHWNLERPRKVDVVQGASFIVRREVLDQIGLLDEGYFMYTEEVDFCYRLKNACWDLYFIPSSQVIHYGGQSTRQIAQKMFLKLYESRLQYFRKNHGSFQAWVYKIILMSAALTRVMISPLAKFYRERQSEHYHTLANYYRSLLVELPKM